MGKAGVVIIAVVVLALAASSCGRKSGPRPEAKAASARVPVEIAQATEGSIASSFVGTAALEAEEETDVVAKVGGVVKQIMVEEGDYVRADDVLARLDDERIAVQVRQAEANLQNLEREYHRSEELFNEHLISDQEFQKGQYEYEAQRATCDLARLDYEYTSIRSPIAGVVAERLVKVGNMVVPNAAVFRVAGLNPLLAVLHVPERQIGKIRAGHAAALTADAVPGVAFAGVVRRISPVVDASTGTGKVTVEVRDASGMLKAGLFVRVSIVHDVHENAVLVPKDAVIDEDKESAVFVVSDSTAYRRVIETGFVNSTHIEVLEGLAPGDTVVTTGKGSLKDSTRVDAVSAGQQASGAR